MLKNNEVNLIPALPSFSILTCIYRFFASSIPKHDQDQEVLTFHERNADGYIDHCPLASGYKGMDDHY